MSILSNKVSLSPVSSVLICSLSVLFPFPPRRTVETSVPTALSPLALYYFLKSVFYGHLASFVAVMPRNFTQTTTTRVVNKSLTSKSRDGPGIWVEQPHPVLHLPRGLRQLLLPAQQRQAPHRPGQHHQRSESAKQSSQPAGVISLSREVTSS